MEGIDKIIEQQLRRYLDARGWRYQWQEAVGAKVPEATLLDDSGRPIAVIEATWLPEFQPSSKKPEQVKFLEEAMRMFKQGEPIHIRGGPVYRTHSLTERLQAKQQQAQSAHQQSLPFLLAMHGLELRYCGRDVYEMLLKHPEFSAIGMLHVESAISTAQRRYRRKNSLPEQAQDLLTVIRDQLATRYGYQLGHETEDFEEFLLKEQRAEPANFSVMSMEILHNPHARLPWPRQLIGVFDTVYEWREDTKQFEVVQEGEIAILRLLATRLLAGSVSVPWQEATSTSRSEDFYEERDPAAHSA